MPNANLISFAGIFVLAAIAWGLSANRRQINWRAVWVGIALQVTIAIFIFQVPAGTKLFSMLNDAVVRLMDCATAGSRFLFGVLSIPPGATGASGEPSLGFILVFQAFPTIIFFSSLIAVLYFLNIMPLIINGLAKVFTKLMRISGVEALLAASNIFVGVESALTVKPYLSQMSASQLCVLLTTGMATVSSNILALYIFSLHDYFPQIAGHLISASLLSAPAAIVMAKLLLPDEGSELNQGAVAAHHEKDSSLFEAVINGANAGVKMIVGISALLMAVLGLIALIDLLLGFIGSYVNEWMHWHFAWGLKDICGYLFYPVTFLLGINPQDAPLAARLIGERLIVTEVVAYQDLAIALKQGLVHDPRSTVIISYALCGFAHIASMAIFVGGAAALAPNQTKVLTQVAGRALLAATLACLMTAAVAGAFYW